MRPALGIPLVLLAIAAGIGTGACRRDGIDPDRRAAAQEAYNAVCARCHGPDGRGGVPVAGVQPRNFRDPAFQRGRTDADLADAIKSGRGAMPAFGALYDDGQIAALVQLIRDFK